MTVAFRIRRYHNPTLPRLRGIFNQGKTEFIYVIIDSSVVIIDNYRNISQTFFICSQDVSLYSSTICVRYFIIK